MFSFLLILLIYKSNSCVSYGGPWDSAITVKTVVWMVSIQYLRIQIIRKHSDTQSINIIIQELLFYFFFYQRLGGNVMSELSTTVAKVFSLYDQDGITICSPTKDRFCSLLSSVLLIFSIFLSSSESSSILHFDFLTEFFF